MSKTFSTKPFALLARFLSSEPILFAANESTDAANEASGYVLGQIEYAANEGKENWVQLSPFGKFPHPLGMQVFNQADSDNCVNEFESVWNKALGNGSKMGFGGLPWYVGHPDNDAFRAQYPDKSAKGRIKQLETRSAANCAACADFCNQTSQEPCREHGLFGNVKWNDEGKRLIANESFHGHSVNWRIKRVGNELHPIFLKSVGFTNEPNIPVSQITAANEEQKMNSLLDFINKLLKPAKPYASNEEAEAGMTDYANEREKAIKDAADKTQAIADLHKKFCSNESLAPLVTSLATAGFEVPNEAVVVFLANELLTADKFIGDGDAPLAALKTAGVALPDAGIVPFLANELTTARSKATKAEADLTAANESRKTDLANARKERAKNICDLLLTGGFVNKAEHDAMVTEFANEAQYDATLTRALALKPKFNTASQVGTLGNVDQSIKSKTDTMSKYNELVNQHQEKNPRKSYIECCNAVDTSPEGKALVALMKQPDTSKVGSRKNRQQQ